MRGTPKTLREAIVHGIREAGADEFMIERHVLDFLRQRFGVAYLEMGELRDQHGAFSPAAPAMAILERLAAAIGVAQPPAAERKR